jgi:hypothetical protein
MWIRAGFFVLVLAGSVLGGVEAVSAASGLIACGSGSYENSDGQCFPTLPEAAALPEGRLPCAGTGITPTAPTTRGLARATVVCPSG